MVEVLPETARHGDYYRDEEIGDRLVLPDSTVMFAVTTVPESVKDFFPSASSILIASGGGQWGRSLALSENNIVGIVRGCFSVHPMDCVWTTTAESDAECLLAP